MYKKRPRSPDTDCEECLPISKRINRLQIESGDTSGVYKDHNSNMGICATSNGVLNHKEQEKEDISIQCRNMRLTSDPSNNMRMTPDQSTSSGIPCGLSDVNSVSSIQRAISLPQGDNKKLPYDMQDGYKPEIEQRDSQVYYQINNVLFNAHVERCKRTNEDESSY